jgi:transcription elongation GreA/GreB family factor
VSDAGARVTLTPAGRRSILDEVARLEAREARLRDLIVDAREDRTADDDERAATLGLLDEHGRLAARLEELRALLKHAVDVEPGAGDVVGLGATVRVREEDGEETEYTLVSPAEAAPQANRISVMSPLGQALVGRRAGDVATVKAPSGAWALRVLAVGFA